MFIKYPHCFKKISKRLIEKFINTSPSIVKNEYLVLNWKSFINYSNKAMISFRRSNKLIFLVLIIFIIIFYNDYLQKLCRFLIKFDTVSNDK